MAIALPELKLDCRKCSSEEKVSRGCEEDSPIKGTWKIEGGGEFSRCPVTMITPQSMMYIRAYNMFKDGFLPNPGGWMDQPVKFAEVITYIQGLIQKNEEQKQNK